MKRNILFLVIVSSLCFSCTKASDMEVRFIQAVLIDDWDVEPTRFVECFEGKEIKDVAVPPSEFDSIYNGFRKTGCKKFWEPECWICLNTSIGQVFIDHKFDAFTKDSDSISVNPRIIYLIRKYCGYYNGMPEEELQYLPDSKYFNLLQGYKYSPQPQRGKFPNINPFMRARFYREE